VGSWRIMEKAGMRFVGPASYYGLEGLKKYVAERGEWVAPTPEVRSTEPTGPRQPSVGQ
jgi:hypothetical protein